TGSPSIGGPSWPVPSSPRSPSSSSSRSSNASSWRGSAARASRARRTQERAKEKGRPRPSPGLGRLLPMLLLRWSQPGLLAAGASGDQGERPPPRQGAEDRAREDVRGVMVPEVHAGEGHQGGEKDQDRRQARVGCGEDHRHAGGGGGVPAGEGVVEQRRDDPPAPLHHQVGP